MKVVTWNLGYWQHTATHEKALTYLRNELKPDLALLQEVHQIELRDGEHMLFIKVHPVLHGFCKSNAPSF